MGVFFVIAHVVAGRQAQYLVSLLCFALALTTSGLAWSHSVQSPEQWLLPARLRTPERSFLRQSTCTL
jgi:hypothetical protein